MGLFNFNKKEDYGSQYDISLKDLKVGYTLDHLMKNWEVIKVLIYDWGEDEFTKEYVLESGIDTIHLEVDINEKGALEFVVWKKFSLDEIDSSLKQAIIDNDDSPYSITYENIDFTLKETSQGWCSEENSKEADEFVNWVYSSEKSKELISIDRWDEEEFEASRGRKVGELDFSNILAL